jgi:hypothetical protein
MTTACRIWRFNSILLRVALIVVVICTSAQKPQQDLDLGYAVRDSDVAPNKFNSRPPKVTAEDAFNAMFEDEAETTEGECDFGIGMLWNVEVGSSIFTTPMITDLFSDGNKEIIVPTFTHHIEALDGGSGEDVRGWPISHPSLRTHTRALLIDLNHDGVSEFLVSTYNGVLAFVSQSGEILEDHSIALPKLPIRKDWANFDRKEEPKVTNVDPEIKAKENRAVLNPGIGLPPVQIPEKPKLHEDPLTLRIPDTAQPVSPAPTQSPSPIPTQAQPAVNVPPANNIQQPRPVGNSGGTNAGRRPAVIPPQPSPPSQGQGQGQGQGIPPRGVNAEGQPNPNQNGGNGARNTGDRRVLQSVDDYYGYDHMYDDPYDDYDYYDGFHHSKEEITVPVGVEAELSPEARRSMDLLFHPELFQSPPSFEGDPFNPLRVDQPITDLEILLDVHILATPTVIDLDHDGSLDAVIPVSYFFDEADIASGKITLPEGIDPNNYVASGLVAVDLNTKQIKWSKITHQTTKSVSHPAYQLSGPILVNVDEDAMLDLVVTTPLGSLCVYDWRGVAKKGWPVHMAAFHAGPLVEDVDGDGKVDICAGDLRGNVACYTRNGVEIWETQLDGAISENPTAGDVDGDGWIDVVVPTAKGRVYVLDGRTGKPKPNFPIQTGPVMASVLLVNLNNTNPPIVQDAGLGLHLIFPSLDGYLYVVSGRTNCTQRIDLSESSYSMVVADDVNNDGLLDLVVGTLSGTVAVFETNTKFHPLKSWTGAIQSFNGQTAREGHIGIHITQEYRTPRDVRGGFFQIGYTIEDRRPGKYRTFSPTYFVTATIGKRLIVLTRLYTAPGVYVEKIPTPLERMYGTVFVIMMLPDGRFYEDSVAIGFNMHFLETIKWVLLIPFILTSVALILVKKEHQVELNTYASQRTGRYAAYGAAARAPRHRPIIVTPYDDVSDSDDEEADAAFAEALQRYLNPQRGGAPARPATTRSPTGF